MKTLQKILTIFIAIGAVGGALIFIEFAKQHKELFFYVTRIGCGIAGFRDEEIAPLFAKAIDVQNIALPETFISQLKQ